MADSPSSDGGLRVSRAPRILGAVVGFALITAGAVALVNAMAAAMFASGASPSLGESTTLAIAHVAMIGSVLLAIVGVVKYNGEGFLAATWVFAPLVPPIAAVNSVIAYLISPEAPPLSGIPRDPIAAVYVGLAAAILGWMLSAFPGAQLARRQRAQRRAYDELCQRFRVLSARVETICAMAEAPPNQAPCEAESRAPGDLRRRYRVLSARVKSICTKADAPPTEALCEAEPIKALREAESILAAVKGGLFGSDGEGPALRWVLANGYTSIARELHRVEEALFIVETKADLVGDALHDDLSLEDSGLKNRFTLRRVIRDAMPAISPGAADALLRPVPALPQTAALLMRAQAQAPELSEQEAREALREVRFAINDYRDDIVDSFARGRNRLIWTYLMVAITTYVLVGLGMLNHVPKVALVSVSALYLIGSLVGLFSRLRIESSRPSSNDDYGLYLARLLTGPLLSGLAGVAGVYLVAQAPAFLGPVAAIGSASPAPSASPSPTDVLAAAAQPQPKALVDIYNLTTNHLALAVAAVFGLAPGLLTARLQQQVDRLERDLQRSEPATSTAVAGAAPEGVSVEGS